MGWIRLGDIASKITKGTTPTSAGFHFTDTGVNFVKVESISEDGNFIVDKFAHINNECNNKLGRSQLEENDILFSIAGAIGRTAIVTKDILPANTNQALAIIRIPNGIVDYSFLMYALKSPALFSQYEKQKQGVAQINLSLQNVSDFRIPQFSLDEQRKIAAVLDKVSDLIAKRRQQLDKLDELIKARFVEMFGEPHENPKHWQEDELSHHLKVIGGYAFKSDGFTDEGIPVLRIGNINSGRFLPVNMVYWSDDSALARYKVFPGDLVMSLTGTVGKDDYGNVCILGADYDEYYLNQRNAKLSIEAALNKCYFSELLKFPRIKKRLTGISRGVRQANISNKDILTLRVPIPPIELQEQFAAFVEQTENTKTTISESLEKLETLKKALMQEYFG